MEEASSIDQGLVEKEGRLLTYLYVWAQLYSIYMMEKHRHNIQHIRMTKYKDLNIGNENFPRIANSLQCHN